MKRLTKQVEGEKITYWRSIDNRRRTEEYIKSIENEFAQDIIDITSMDRRSMLKVMGASIALSGLGVACRRPVEKILPYVNQPESITPGIPNYFATAKPSPFGASPILVESHEGRPTKIEGNPHHQDSLGRSSLFSQASILELYDPDRSKYVKKDSNGLRLPADWADFDALISQKKIEFSSNKGEGLAFLLDTDLSPTLLRLKKAIKLKYPKVKFYTHEPLRRPNTENACQMAFGKHARVSYRLDKAKIICTLFADPLAFGPELINNIHNFARNRQINNSQDVENLNRLYSVEAEYSLTGTNADHRLKLSLGMAKKFIEALAFELYNKHKIDIPPNIIGSKSFGELIKSPPNFKGLDRKFISVLASDLAKNQGKAVIIPGEHLSPELQGVVHAVNIALQGLNNVFKVIKIDDIFCQELLDEPDIYALKQDLDEKKIHTLVIMGVNPVYTAPRTLDFKEALENAKLIIHHGLFYDETAKCSHWHVPKTHFLEEWGDTRDFRGTISIVQPLILPLHGARSSLQFLSQWADNDLSPLDTIKKSHNLSQNLFNQSLYRGFIEGSEFSALDKINLDCQNIYDKFIKHEHYSPNENNLELILNFDKKILDGRYANLSWLQELPDAVTKINWDNALFMSPKLAKSLNINSGVKKNAYVAEVVLLEYEQTKIKLPVFVMPGIADYSLIATLGYGRQSAGKVGDGVGVDCYDLLPSFSQMFVKGIKITQTQETYRISTTQEQFAMNADVVQEVSVLSLKNRDPARVADLKTLTENPKYAQEKEGLPENLLMADPHTEKEVPLQITKPWDYSKGNQWGMVIDLNKCTGCNACVVACQSENNIPVVGKEQVIRGRLMHWIRVDRYFTGDVGEPKSVAQPVLCQHCENAPCEPVCPVAATTHDKEGLNVMTYNRCIGTRYCANNCPYKVRRFNYFDFTHTGNIYVSPEIKEREKTLKLQRNPDVTVRYRGVMEKCTYCTQRIQEAKMSARRNNQDPNNLPDGSVTPACAQTCPAEAITFGNINDDDSKVANLKKQNRNYTMLDTLNVRPRTSYLSKVRNPHPDLV